MKKEVMYCDLCHEEIWPREGDGHFLVTGRGPYQAWPTLDGIRDICFRCCERLAKAKLWGMIAFDESPLIEATGFVKDDKEAWVAKEKEIDA